ncbi:MAG: CPBP family intramembrane metalloprotease [Lachnospiraceae bacterium]|nr:CPBP family intramembrane metalloprotease [Lachnospiraceae bacterium]
MKKQGMTPFRSGLLYMIIIINFITLSVLLSAIILLGYSVNFSLTANTFLSEGVVLVPALLFALGFRAEVGEVFRFRNVKFSTILLTLVMVFCLYPLINALNAFTMFFTDNVAVEMTSTMISSNNRFSLSVLTFAIVGPFCEELVFRGVIYAGLRRSGRILPAILLQALMFGCMHLNFNQMAYAFVIGIAFGFLTEVTGSIYPGFIGHAMINFSSVAAAYLAGDELMDEAVYTNEAMAFSFGIYSVLAVFFTIFAAALVYVISRNETGGVERFMQIFKKKDLRIVDSDGAIVQVRRPHVWTVPAIFGLLLALAIMVISI